MEIMTGIFTIIFLIGYIIIAFEHPLKINKSATALLLGTLLWTAWVYMSPDNEAVNHKLAENLADISQILFFLLSAMTIVEIVDAHQGFTVITNRVSTKSIVRLAWIFGVITFILSAILDNLTTAIVMISLARKLIKDREQRLLFAGLIIIAANAGGAWTPIGDVTTTMLWVGGQISTLETMKSLLVPSLFCLFIPLLFISLKLKGQLKANQINIEKQFENEKIKGSRLMFFMGVGGLVFVPIFKIVTHLPPYIGILLSLSAIWIVSELLHVKKSEEEKKPYSAVHALSRIDTSCILFFLGILLAIGALQASGILNQAARFLDTTVSSHYTLAFIIGLFSAVIDNVPLVAAIQKMYPLASSSINPEIFQYAQANLNTVVNGAVVVDKVKYFLIDAQLWQLIAYTAGTGGSCLIIGSAAGVAVMGIEKIDFVWYFKNISLLALIGYASGFLAYIYL